MIQPPRSDVDPGTASRADRIAAVVRAVPGVADLHPGMFGEVGTYLPGRIVPGVRMDGPVTDVHVSVDFDADVRDTTARVRTALVEQIGGDFNVTFEEVAPALPHPPSSPDESSDEPSDESSDEPSDEPSGDDRRGERRRDRNAHSPMTTLAQMPALVLLERLPVPALATTHDGTVLFANTAFADMVGHTLEALRSLSFSQLFHTLPATGSAIAAMHAHAGLLVELMHADGSTVRATMSRSALLRGDDPVALATFLDITEQLWTNPPTT